MAHEVNISNYEEQKSTSRAPELICVGGADKQKRYTILVCLTVCFVIAVSAFAVVLTLKKSDGVPQLPVADGLVQTKVEANSLDSSVCMTKGCVRAAHFINERLDDSRDPCDDFFDFACGRFVKKTIIPDEKSSVSMFSEVQDNLREKMRLLVEADVNETADSTVTIMAKNIYQNCLDIEKIEKEGLTPLTDILKELGGWPVVEGDSWDPSNFSYIETNYMHRKIGFSIDYLFDFSVATDVKNSSWRILWFDQPSLGMSREYLMRGLNDTDVQAYLKYSIDMAVLLGADPERAKKEMMEVLDLQIQIANISLPREQRRNMTKLYNIRTLDQMSLLAPEVPWVEYVNNLLGVEEIQVTGAERVGVSDPNFFVNLMKILKVTSPRTLANYMRARVTSAAGGYLSKNIRDIQLEYNKKLTGKATRPPRWKECMGLVSGKLAFAIGNLYAKNFFNEKAKSQALELVRYIRHEFDIILDNLDWMDATTKKSAKTKSKAIRPHIAYPDEVLDDDKLSEHYKELVIDRGNLLANMRRIGIFGTNFSFRKLREKVDKLDWKRNAAVAVVNAYYSSIENSIKFPAGILQGVFFEPDRPNYLNFGGIGFVIGHEITHGFDDQGKQFDAEGNLHNWWDKSTESEFLKKAKCIINQYANYTAPENNMKLNGINTQGENIADNGGIREAYKAYQKWTKDHGEEKTLPSLKYSQNQLFWISAGQVWCSKYRPQSLKVRILTGVHSPGRFRVQGSFSNSEDFARDFQCPVGSKMNPKKKCLVW